MSRYFPDIETGPAGPAVVYDFHTRFAGQFGGKDPYIMGKDAMLDDLGDYIAQEREA